MTEQPRIIRLCSLQRENKKNRKKNQEELKVMQDLENNLNYH